MGWLKFFFGDNTSPSWAKERTRSDGKKDVIYGNKGDKDHGHSVRSSSGDVEYSRTAGGKVIIDK